MKININNMLAIVTISWFHLAATEERRLSKWIRHFEGLNYDKQHLHQQHARTRRSLNPTASVRVHFHAHDREFNLRLRRDTSTFSKNVEIELPGGRLQPHDVSHIYEGEVMGDSSSYVHGSIIGGVFGGKIYTKEGNFYVERADFYFHEPRDFHSVVYRESDVEENPHKDKMAEHEHSGCGNNAVKDWMKSVQNSAVPVDDPIKQNPQRLKRDTRDHFYATEKEYTRESHNIYSRHHNQAKREIGDRTTCTMYLQSDFKLWDRMTSNEMDVHGKKIGLGFSPDRAREEIASLFASHVNGIKKIYQDTIFSSADSSINYKGISFVVRRVKINETLRDCPQGEPIEKNSFCNPNVDVSNFLNINSLQKHDDFCLAYVFTYRDFIGGTLGLAWVGSPSRASGGICELFKEYQENNVKVFKSLNTGIVTLINYNSPVPPKVSTLTFAHEVGHNFGSPHDSGPKCTPFSATPSDANGNFIMYASATSGDRPNNSKFSPCSKDNISAVLDAVIEKKFGKTNCFVERESAFCGNNIVEGDEECDCGYKEDCDDECCYGRGEPNQCQLRANKQCSPSQGPCCNTNCTKVQKDALECFSNSDCSNAAYCNGINATCPKPDAKPNMTTCNEHTQVCLNGECQGSICQNIGWQQCFLTAPKDSNSIDVDKGKLCFVACQSADNMDCVSTGDTEALEKPENSDLKELLAKIEVDSIKLPPGAPCNEFRGYCDVFQKCRDVDADGPLARLKKLLFNEQTFNEIRTWIIRYWWAVLIMGIGLVVFMGVFIKLCAVHTPSSNPKKPPARKLTLRPQHHRHQGPPPPYSGPSRGGPPHGKGRGRAGAYEMQPQKV